MHELAMRDYWKLFNEILTNYYLIDKTNSNVLSKIKYIENFLKYSFEHSKVYIYI